MEEFPNWEEYMNSFQPPKNPFQDAVNEFRDTFREGRSLNESYQTRSALEGQYSFFQTGDTGGALSLKPAESTKMGTRAVDYMGRQNGSALELMFAGRNAPDPSLFSTNLTVDSKVDANTKIRSQSPAKVTLNPDGTLSVNRKGEITFDFKPGSLSDSVKDTMLNRELYHELSKTGAFGSTAGNTLRSNLERVATNLGEDPFKAFFIKDALEEGKPNKVLEQAYADGVFEGTTWEQGLPEQYRIASSPTEPSVGKNAELLGVKGNGTLSIGNSALDNDLEGYLVNEADLGSTPQEDLARVKFTPEETVSTESPKTTETSPTEPPKTTEPLPEEPPPTESPKTEEPQLEESSPKEPSKSAEPPKTEEPLKTAEPSKSAPGTGRGKPRPELLGRSSGRTQLGNGLSGFMSKAKDAVMSAGSTVADKAKSVGGAIANRVTGLIGEKNADRLKGFFGKSSADKPSKVDEIKDRVVAFSKDAADKAVQLGGQAKEKAVELGSQVKEKASSVINKVSNLSAQDVRETAKNLGEKAKDIGSNIVSKVQEIPTSAVTDQIKAAVTGGSSDTGSSGETGDKGGGKSESKGASKGAGKTEQATDDFLKGMKKNKLAKAGLGGALLFAGAYAFFGNGQRRNEDLYGRPF